MSDSPSPPNPELPSELEKTALFSPADSAAQLVSVLDHYLADLQAGKTPDRAQLLADHPELARELADCLAGIEFVHQAAKPTAGIPAQLGDFRILAELGRGGMGVVYEAEQLSLKRHVALKVLRFGVPADADVMQRFQREAETVAHLHHTNIVPIHAVGCEQGVHYYAMQFIAGQSLAAEMEILERERGSGKAGDFRRITGWVLQAAEALAYAHQRGVIHRDIKPSNLILDPEGTVWLTDFGLAKRADEVTLTAAGILMGTPRYMSPEQAAAAQQPIDHRTDIYSLGATLYELVTGKPVFDGTTPQGVITQILNAEPIAPRVLQGTLPRDLETIILKCLAKDPVQRYQQARDLAEDLRAYLDNRPIRARRATLQERVVRWARKNQRSTVVSAVTAAASLLLIAGSWVGWQVYQESQLGRLLFTTDGPTLVAEVLNSQGEAIIPGFPVPNPQPVALPAGPYQVRFSGPGVLSETWQVNVDQGGPQTIPVKMVDRRLGPPLNITGLESPQLIELDGRTHIVHRAEQGWRLVKGDTLQPVWPADLKKVLGPAEMELFPRSQVNDGGADLLQLVYQYSPGGLGSAPAVVHPAADLNGDGRHDLVFASRVSPSLLGISGETGQVLWWYRALSPLSAEHDSQHDSLDPKLSSENAGVIGQPMLTMLNDEPVVVAFFVSLQSQLRTRLGKEVSAGRKMFVEAVSARTGTRLWRSDCAIPEFRDAMGQEIMPQTVIRKVNGQETILLHVGSRLLAWELKTGKECWSPHDLGAVAAQSAQFSDLDGDGELEAVLAFFKAPGDVTVRAISLKNRQQLWERNYTATQSLNPSEWRAAGREMAWTVDLNGDGRGEVLIPIRDNWGVWGKHWYGLEMLDGATGSTRWQRKLRSVGQFSGSGPGVPLQVVVGPDLDGDAMADLFATSGSSRLEYGLEFPTLQIDAVSGRDGRQFWRQRQPVDTASVSTLGSLPRWWQSGDDGWPQLVVPAAKGVGGQPVSYVFAANTGRLMQSLPDVADPNIADINDDGIADLWYLSKAQDIRRMTVLVGMPPVNWRRPGTWRRGSDFDGDGTIDYLEFQSGRLVGRSGQDGRVLWTAPQTRTGLPFVLIDLNHDGTDDVVMVTELRRQNQTVTSISYEYYTALAGYCGKTGRQIWTSSDCGLRNSGSSVSGGYPDEEYSIPMLGKRDLNGDGRPEIIVGAYFGDRHNFALAAFAGDDQALMWKLPVEENCLKSRTAFDRIFQDLNGDGVLDVVVSAAKTLDDTYGNLTAAGLRAYDGRDAKPLWSDAPADRFPLGTIAQGSRMAMGDMDGDGISEVIVPARDKGADSATGLGRCELIVLDGRTGERKWSWPWVSDGQFLAWRPILINLDGDRTRCICLGIHEQRTSQIVILDSGGTVRRKIPVSGLDFWTNVAGRDLDGDGRDELVFRNQNELQVYRDLDQSTLWKQPAVSNWFRLLQPPAGTPVSTDTLTLQYGAGTAIGLESATGAVRWRSEPPRQENQSLHSELILPANPTGRAVSVSVDSRGESTLEQNIWSTDANGRFQSPPTQPMTYAPFDDPDRLHPLPWVPVGRFRGWARLDSHERIDLFIALSLVAVVALRFLVWIRQKQWRRAFLYLSIAPVISLLAAVVMLVASARRLADGESYAWSGWSWILIHGTTSLAMMTIVATVVVWAFRLVRMGLRRWRAASP